MLVLSRRLGERIYFPSLAAYVEIVDVRGGTVRLGIEAPENVLVLRAELRDAPASACPCAAIPRLADQAQSA